LRSANSHRLVARWESQIAVLIVSTFLVGFVPQKMMMKQRRLKKQFKEFKVKCKAQELKSLDDVVYTSTSQTEIASSCY